MYYLHHYFDPDFSHVRLTPAEGADDVVDSRYLGYVQNVVAGQVLAEIIDLEQHPDTPRDPRFIYRERHLPIGPNCALHRENPDRIVAAANGYVFYHDGLISVKKLLNVRGNVGFHTGNILFVGDLAVHGDVLTNFAVQARNVLVKGHVESAKVKAVEDLVCLSGIKGANTSAVDDGPVKSADLDGHIPSTLIEAGGNIRLPFCEHVQIRARGNVIIDGSCLHSTLYVGGNLVIKGRLQGGVVYANRAVYVEGQFGGDYTTASATLTVASGGAPDVSGLRPKVQRVSGMARVLFTPKPGFTHVVEYSNTLGGGTWTALPGTPHNSGAVDDASSLGVPRRFYRVKVSP